MSFCIQLGSSPLVAVILVKRQHACPEQLRASSAIHFTLDCPQAVDLAFRLAVAPRQFDGAADGVKIAVQDACEPLNCDQARINGIVNPPVELAWITAAKDSAEAHAKDRSRRRAVLDQPLRAAPTCEKPLEIRETARVTALFEIVEQMPSAAIAISPALGEKRLEI